VILDSRIHVCAKVGSNSICAEPGELTGARISNQFPVIAWSRRRPCARFDSTTALTVRCRSDCADVDGDLPRSGAKAFEDSALLDDAALFCAMSEV